MKIKIKKRKLSPFLPMRKNGVWNLERDGVTQSFLSTWNGCREEARLRFIEGWTPNENSKPIEFGSCFHWVLSELYKYETIAGAKLTLKDLLKRYAKVWAAEAGGGIVSRKALDQQTEVYELAKIVLPQYLKHWRGDWTGNYSNLAETTVRPVEWIGLERRFQIPYSFSTLAAGRGKLRAVQLFLNGCFDGVFRDKFGNLWLFETKTKSMIDETGIEDTLHLDRQVMFYLTALWLLFGEMPKGVLYNVIRRPGQRWGKTESAKQFYDKVAADVTNPKRQQHYFKRWQLTVMPKELKTWRSEHLDPQLIAVRDWWKGNAPHFMNPDALNGKYGRSAMFEPIVHGSFYGLHQREKAFNELTDVATI